MFHANKNLSPQKVTEVGVASRTVFSFSSLGPRSISIFE